MPPKEPSGTISGPNEAGPYAFGDTVTFDTTTDDLKGNQYPLIYVVAHAAEADDEVAVGDLLYGQLDLPGTAFLLGGGSSKWHQHRLDANVDAILYAYGGKYQGHDTIVQLAVVEFDASG